MQTLDLKAPQAPKAVYKTTEERAKLSSKLLSSEVRAEL
jgi:hypothetical protein